MVVGEVDFFVLSVDQIEAKCKPPREETDGTWVHASAYNATFFGSDFNYATQQEFRFKFRSLT